MEEKKRPLKKWLYWFLLAVAIIFVYKTLDNFDSIIAFINNLLEVLAPFLIGILIAYLLYTPCKKIEKLYSEQKKWKFMKKKARALSILTVYLIALLALIITFNVLIPVIANSVVDLVSNLQNYYTMALQEIESLPEDSLLKADVVLDAINSLQKIDLKQYINLERIAGYAKGAINIASKIIDLFVAVVVSVYILRQRDDILGFGKKFGRAMLKKDTYSNMEKYFNRTNEIFFNFLAGQILDGIIVGIITSIAMAILGVKYAILLGFMIGLFNLIPYFGAIVAVIIATLITALTGGIGQAITLIIVVTILQQIDANIINPKILGTSLKISPLLVILAVTLGGAYFGVLGMFLSVPVFTVLKTAVVDYINYKNKIKNIEEKEEARS